jgi:ATP-dependent Clp protease ATP-binding subunit ClpC
MFERFTDRARRVVVLAQEEARDLGHNYIGTEHILLGLLRESDGVAARALVSMGISLDVVRGQVKEIIGQGDPSELSGHIPFTPRAKKVLELSLREALQLGHNYIGTEHILLGLIREGEGVAAQVLVTLGADLNRVRQQVIHLLHGYQGGEPMSSGDPGGEREHGGSGRSTPAQAAMEARIARSARVFSQTQLDSVMGRIGEVVNRLDVIAERLAAIEGHLAEGRRPVARAPRKPPAASGPPARKPKPPPTPPPAAGPPAAKPPRGGPSTGGQPPGGEAQRG